jgi:hypothetical protein
MKDFWRQQTPAAGVALKGVLFGFGAIALRLVADYIGSVVLAILATMAVLIALGVTFWAIFFLPNR